MFSRTHRSGVLLAALSLLTPLEAAPDLLTEVQVVRDSASGLSGSSAVAVSPDGLNAYVTSYSGGSLAMFVRDLTANEFRYIGKLVDGQDGVDGLHGASAVAVSPDGLRVYVTGQTANALAVFDRSASSGTLSYTGVLREGVEVTAGLAAPTGVAVAPNGHVFVSSAGDDALSEYQSSFPTLVQVGVWKNGDANPVVGGTISGMMGATGVVATTGVYGTDVYVSSEADSSVSAFTTNFLLSQRYQSQVVQDGVGGFDGLAQAAGLALSPDGHRLYVAGTGDSAVAVLARNPSSSLLSFDSLAQNGVAGVSGMQVVNSVCAEPSGTSVYVGGGESGPHFSFGQHLVALAVDTFDFSLGFVQSLGLLDRVGVGGSHVAVASLPDSSKIVAAESISAKFALPGQLSIFDRDSGTGALAEQQTIPDGDGVLGLRDAQGVAVTPDGKHVYATGRTYVTGDESVAAFTRDPTSGALTFVGSESIGISDPRDLAVSPLGDMLYVSMGGGLTLLRIDSTSGSLSYVQSITGGALLGCEGVAVSPNGATVYVACASTSSVSAYARQPDGTLQPVGVYQNGQGGVTGLSSADAVAVSPDGLWVYALGFADDTVVAFSRDPGTGALAFSTLDRNGTYGVSGIQGPGGVAVSPDGKNVYVLSQYDRSVTVFARTPTYLGFVEAHPDFVAHTCGVHEFVPGVSVSSDGRFVFAVSDWACAVSVFARDAGTGALTLLETKRQGDPGIDGLAAADGLALSPDGRSVYVASGISTSDDGSLAVFAPEPDEALLACAASLVLGSITRRRSTPRTGEGSEG